MFANNVFVVYISLRLENWMSLLGVLHLNALESLLRVLVVPSHGEESRRMQQYA